MTPDLKKLDEVIAQCVPSSLNLKVVVLDNGGVSFWQNHNLYRRIQLLLSLMRKVRIVQSPTVIQIFPSIYKLVTHIYQTA
jgi:hypothetical protein